MHYMLTILNSKPFSFSLSLRVPNVIMILQIMVPMTTSCATEEGNILLFLICDYLKMRLLLVTAMLVLINLIPLNQNGYK